MVAEKRCEHNTYGVSFLSIINNHPIRKSIGKRKVNTIPLGKLATRRLSPQSMSTVVIYSLRL